MPIIALVRPDGTGTLRRIYELEDHRFQVDFAVAQPAFEGDFRAWKTKALQAFLGAQLQAQSQRVEAMQTSMSARHRGLIKRQWIRGKERELLRLCELASQSVEDFTRWEIAPEVAPLARYEIRSTTVVRPMHLADDVFARPNGAQPVPLAELFAAFRVLHECVAQRLEWGGIIADTFPLHVEPVGSSHERLEAMMRLRDAVRGTSIEDEVARVLSQAR